MAKLYTQQKFYGFGESTLLDRIKEEKSEGYYKKGTFSIEIIWNNKSFVFPHKKKESDYSKFKSGLFLYSKVRKDARLFLEKNENFKKPKEHPSIVYAKTYNQGKFTATDLNHAYWRIAYNKGIISKLTYEMGMRDDFKQTRLSALSTLGKGRSYQVIKNGKISRESVKFGQDEKMEAIYNLIRYTCFQYMVSIKKLLGKDFVCYKTDCIYYVDSKENRKLVNDFLKKKGLLMKQFV